MPMGPGRVCSGRVRSSAFGFSGRYARRVWSDLFSRRFHAVDGVPVCRLRIGVRSALSGKVCCSARDSLPVRHPARCARPWSALVIS